MIDRREHDRPRTSPPGLEPWGKAFIALRSSRETELTAEREKSFAAATPGAASAFWQAIDVAHDAIGMNQYTHGGEEAARQLRWIDQSTPWAHAAAGGTGPRSWGDIEIGPMIGPSIGR